MKAVSWMTCEGSGTNGLEEVGNVGSTSARGWALGTNGGFVPFGLLVAVVGGTTGDQLHENEAEGVDVGPRACGTKALGVELLGGSIVRGKRREATGSPCGKLCSGLPFLHGLGNAEVEDLERRASRGLDSKQIGGFDVAVCKFERVGKSERVNDRSQQMDSPHFVVGGKASEAVIGKDGGEVFPFEPLEDKVGDGAADESEVEHVDDGGVVGEAEEQFAFCAEALAKQAGSLWGEVGGDLEALDSNGFFKAEVMAPIDDTEAPFPNDLVDAVFAVDGGADKGKRIACHGVPRNDDG